MDPRMRPQFMLYQHQRQGAARVQGGGTMPIPGHNSPTQSSQNNHGLAESPRVPPPHMGPVPKVCITSHENDPPEVIPWELFFSKSKLSCILTVYHPTKPQTELKHSADDIFENELKVFDNVENIVGEKEKLMITSIFSFSNNVFNRYLFMGC